jgi:hypothetical protein
MVALFSALFSPYDLSHNESMRKRNRSLWYRNLLKDKKKIQKDRKLQVGSNISFLSSLPHAPFPSALQWADECPPGPLVLTWPCMHSLLNKNGFLKRPFQTHKLGLHWRICLHSLSVVRPDYCIFSSGPLVSSAGGCHVVLWPLCADDLEAFRVVLLQS